jgi:AcrR family transcriptional regulator
LSTYGYANLALERVASEAGYTRGAIYHLFANKEDLALAVVGWVHETWTAEVGHLAVDEADPVAALIAMARAHAVYCRRDVARVMLALRVEFTGQDHPVGRAITEILDPLEATCARLVDAGRSGGAIPAGPPAHDVANAYLSMLEALGIALAGRDPYDVQLAEQAVRGLLGLQATENPPRCSEAEGSTASPGEETHK